MGCSCRKRLLDYNLVEYGSNQWMRPAGMLGHPSITPDSGSYCAMNGDILWYDMIQNIYIRVI